MKKSLLVTLLLAFLLPWAVKADELTVYDGTATSSTIPFYGLYADTQGAASECILDADSLANMAGGQITSMTFYISTPADAAWTGTHQVYLGEIDESELTTIAGPDAYTIVYTGSFDATGTELTVTFDEPFAYSGGNLVIGTYVSVAGNWKSAYFKGVSQTINTARSRSSATGNGSVQKFVPKTTFEYEAGGGIDCDKPSSLDVAEITIHGASLGWADGSGVYNLEYKKRTDEDWTSLLSATGDFSYDLTDLDPFTTYQVRVQSICDDTVSGWKSVSFTTLAGVPFIENFNGTSMPSGWSQASGLLDNIMSGSATLSSGAGWNFGERYVFDSHAYVNIYGESCNKWLIMPEILVEENTQLTFDLALTKFNAATAVDKTKQQDDKFIVLASVDAGETWEVLRQWDNQGSEDVYNDITNAVAGQSVVIDLSDYADQNVTLAFYGESTASGGDNDLHIDNVRVDYVPLCEKPYDLAVIDGSATENSVELEWVDEMASTWLLQYKKSTVEDWTSYPEVITENPFVLEGLDASSTYQVRIAAWCDPSDSATISLFANPISFATECGLLTVAANNIYTEDFEAYDGASYSSNGVIPNCWESYSTGSVRPHVIGSGSYYYKHSGSKALTFYGSGYCYAALPLFSNALNELRIKFWMQTESASNGTLALGYITEGDVDFSTFQVIETYANNTSTMIQRTTDLVEVPAEATRLVFRWYYSSQYSCCIDDIEIMLAPTCLSPTSLAVDSIATDMAVLSWNAIGGENSWLVQYKLAADSMWISVEDPVTEKPYELADLMPATRYEVRVAAWCDTTNPDDISEFTEPIKVITECMPLAIDADHLYAENFDIYSAGSGTTAPSSYPNDMLPDCWAFLNRSQTSGSYPQAFITTNSSYAVSGNCLFFKSSASTPIYAILPEFEAEIAGLQLSFTYRNEGTSASNGTLHVGYMTNPSEDSTYTEVAVFAQTTQLTQQDVSFVNAPAGSRMAFKYQGGSSNNYFLSIDNVVVAPLPSCVKPREIAASNVTSHTATLAWTAGADETAWHLLINGDLENIIDANSNPFVLTDLPADSTFVVRVRANCEGEVSDWSNDSVRFTTLVACPAPLFSQDSIQNILATSADLVWGGFSDSYIVSYRTAAYVDGVEEGFEDESSYSNWTVSNLASESGVTTAAAHSGSYGFSFKWTSNPPQYLISPAITGLAAGATLQFYYKNYSSSYPETFQVGYSSTDNEVTSFTFGDEITVSDVQWHLFSEVVPAGTMYFCIKCTSDDQYYLYVDDIMLGEAVEAGEWVIDNAVSGNSLQLTDLTPETKYDVKIQGNCGDEGLSAETAILTFRTISNCQTPTAVEVLEVGLDSVVLSWNGYGLTEFNLRYSDDAENWIVMNDVTIPCVIRGLNPSTVYAVQVQATCDTEKWSIGYTFSTKDGIPFADAGPDGILSNWYAYKTLASDVFDGQELSGSGSWSVAAADDVFEGSHFKLNIYGGSCKDWLVSPSIDATNVQLAADEKLKLGFTMALAKWNGSGSLATVADTTGIDDKFIVVFSIDDGETWSEANATVWDNAGSPNVFNDIPNTGVDILLDFSAGAGHVMRIAFYGESTVSNADNNIFIGNILLDVVGNTTGIDALENSTDAVKFFKDGKIYIRFNGVTYDAVGRIIRK